MPFLQVDDDTLARLKELHRKRSLGVATGWQELDTVLSGLLGPMDRRKRCERCNDEGRLLLGTELTMACPVCGGQNDG